VPGSMPWVRRRSRKAWRSSGLNSGEPTIWTPRSRPWARHGPPRCLPATDCPFSFSCCPDIGLAYWSSTTRFAAPIDAWAVDLTEGNDRITLKTDPAAPGTLAVRGKW